MNDQCVAKNGGEHPVCQFHLLTMPVCIVTGQMVTLLTKPARNGGPIYIFVANCIAVERGDDGYGKTWRPFLAVAYDVEGV